MILISGSSFTTDIFYLVWADEEWLKKYAMNEEEDDVKEDTVTEEKKALKMNPKVRFVGPSFPPAFKYCRCT